MWVSHFPFISTESKSLGPEALESYSKISSAFSNWQGLEVVEEENVVMKGCMSESCHGSVNFLFHGKSYIKLHI